MQEFPSGMIIVDLEATCCEFNTIPRDQSEMIQIGAALVNHLGDRISSFSTFIKPQLHPKLTEFCTSLTGITQAQVNDAPTFEEAIALFDDWVHSNWHEHNGVWGSWGAYDLNQFNRELIRNSIESYLPAMNHINLKKAFGQIKKVKPMGLAGALRLEGLGFLGRAHNGLDDAINIGRLKTVQQIIKTGYEQWPDCVTEGV